MHRGLCTTCPIYQLLGDELDGPRGRIYLIKQILEGQPVSRETQVHLDLSAEDEARDFMRRNIDAWWPYIEQGIEAIEMTASGCGVMAREYGRLLQHDPAYAAKADRITAPTRDLSEVIAREDDAALRVTGTQRRIAFHAPCILQHGRNSLARWQAF